MRPRQMSPNDVRRTRTPESYFCCLSQERLASSDETRIAPVFMMLLYSLILSGSVAQAATYTVGASGDYSSIHN